MKIFTLKNAVIGLIIVFMVLLFAVVYRMFLQFNSKDVAIYIDEEASKYVDPTAKAWVTKILHDGVEDILSSHYRTQQVISVAKESNLPKEQELVQAALLNAQNLGYIQKISTGNE